MMSETRITAIITSKSSRIRAFFADKPTPFAVHLFIMAETMVDTAFNQGRR
jgi:hypothetical protein